MHIAILGVGKLGLCVALNAERVGYKVTGVDKAEDYVKQLNQKNLVTTEPGVNDLLAAARNFTATTNLKEVVTDDIPLLFIAVATPSMEDGSYNHDQIESVTSQLMKLGVRKTPIHLVVICTVMPGYCETLFRKLSPYNYTVTYNPEFIAQGNILHNQKHADQILVGETDTTAADLVIELRKKIALTQPVVCRMGLLSAEIAKLATNCFLTTKISFANSIGDIALKAGAEPDKILEAVGSDSRIGASYLQYGFGFGGPCFPRDNRALGLFARQLQYPLYLSEATDAVNEYHLQFQTQQYLKNHHPDKTISIIGVAYKAGTTILDNSQQLKLALNLVAAGRKVLIHEREEVVNQLRQLYPHVFDYQIIFVRQ